VNSLPGMGPHQVDGERLHGGNGAQPLSPIDRVGMKNRTRCGVGGLPLSSFANGIAPPSASTQSSCFCRGAFDHTAHRPAIHKGAASAGVVRPDPDSSRFHLDRHRRQPEPANRLLHLGYPLERPRPIARKQSANSSPQPRTAQLRPAAAARISANAPRHVVP